MDCSFMPNGKWFVFATDTGETLRKGLPDKAACTRWMASQAEHVRRASVEASR